MVMIVEVITSFLQLRLDVREPALVAGFGISRVLGSAGSLRHTANRARWAITMHDGIVLVEAYFCAWASVT